MRKKLFSMLALLCLTAAGAWAQGTVYNSSVAVNNLKAGDILVEGAQVAFTSDNSYYLYFLKDRFFLNDATTPTTMDFVHNTTTVTVGANGLMTGLSYSATARPATESGEEGNAWEVTAVEGENVKIVGITYDPNAVAIDWNGTTKTGTFTMPAGNVVLHVEYEPEYSATFKALTANTIGTKATVKLDNVAIDTLSAEKNTLNGIYAGQTVTLNAQQGYKFRKVEAKEKSAAVIVTAITLNKTETLLGVGNTETLSVSSVTPDNATDQSVTWSSDNTSVATVDASTGVVTGVAKGTANITATANDGSGVSATCAVKVSTLAAAFVDGAVIKVIFKWRGSNSGDYVQGTYSASSGTFTASMGGGSWGTDSRAVYKVEKSGNNITIGAGFYDYNMEGMQWTFNTTNDTYTYTPGDIAKGLPYDFGLISVTLNGTDITSQLTAQ